MDEGVLLKLNEAFDVLLSAEVTRDLRVIAQQYLDSIAQRNDACLFCWEMFKALSQKFMDTTSHQGELSRVHEIRLWCLSITTSTLPAQPEASRQSLADSIWQDYLDKLFPTLWNRSNLCGSYQVCGTPPGTLSSFRTEAAQDNEGEKLYILNKLLSLMVQLIIIDYPDRLPNAFQVWMNRIAELHTKLDLNIAGTDMNYWETTPHAKVFLGYVYCFLQLLNTLDTEIIADEAASRTPEERQVAMRIKDGLRLGDVHQIFSFFQTIFDGKLFGIQEIIINSVENRRPAPNLPPWWMERCTLALKAMAKMVNWADLILVVNDEHNHFLLFWNVAMLQSFGVLCADAAYECAGALIYKRMDGGQKCLMLKRSNLVEMFLNALASAPNSDLELRMAQTLSIMLLQIIEAITDIQKNKDKSGPYKLQMSVDESREAFKELWNYLVSLAPQAVLMIHNTNQLSVAETLTMSLQDFFRLVKAVTRDMGIVALAGLKGLLASCLEACFKRMRVPESLSWESTFEKPDEYFLEDEDDGSPESEFFVLRKQVLLLFRQAYLLCLHSGDEVVTKFQEFILEKAAISSDWRTTEAGITIISAMLDTYKDTSIYGSAMMQTWLDQSRVTLQKLGPFISIAGCPPPIRQRYFDCLGKLSTFYKQKPLSPEEYKEFLLMTMTSLLGPAGLRSIDSKKCVNIAIRECLRVLRGLRETPGASPEILLPFFDALSNDQYFNIVPVSNMGQMPSYGIDDGDDDVSSGGQTLFHPDIPNLALDDQTKLFEIITVSSFTPTDKQRIVSAVLMQTLSRFDGWITEEEYEKLDEIQRASFTDYVVRMLRSIGNLLKGVHRIGEESKKEIESITRFTLFAANVLGKSTRVQQNLLFIARRLLVCCPEELLTSHFQSLLPILYNQIWSQLNTNSGWAEKRILLCLNNLASLIHALFERHKDMTFPRIFSKLRDNRFLLEWCIEQHQKCINLLFGSTEGTLTTADIAESLQEYHTIFHSIFTVAPTTAVILSLIDSSTSPESPIQSAAQSDVGGSQEAFCKKPIVQSPSTVLESNSDDIQTGPNLNALDNLVRGLTLGLEHTRNQNFVATTIKTFYIFLGNTLANPTRLEEMKLMIDMVVNLYPETAPRFHHLRSLSTRQELLGVMTYAQLRTEVVLRVSVQCIQSSKSILDPATGRVILEFAMLLRGLWTGDWLGKTDRLRSDLLLQQALLPIQSAAMNYLRITLEGGESADELIKALLQSENAQTCKDVMTQWLKGVQCNA